MAQGANGTTSLVLPKLAGAKTYFWRARATSSGTVGLFAAARTFNVGPEVVLQAPVLASPGSGASVSGTVLHGEQRAAIGTGHGDHVSL